MTVSREWQPIAEKKAKEKLTPLFRTSIEDKASGFCKLSSKNIETVCPSYVAKLEQLQKNLNSLSLRAIYEQLHSHIERHHVHIAEIGTFDFSEKAVIGNQFIRFNYTTPIKKAIRPRSEVPSTAIPEEKCYFPLKMFNENSKSVCFTLYGRLIELIRNFSLDQMKHIGRIYYPEAIYRPSIDASGPIAPWKEKHLKKLVDSSTPL